MAVTDTNCSIRLQVKPCAKSMYNTLVQLDSHKLVCYYLRGLAYLLGLPQYWQQKLVSANVPVSVNNHKILHVYCY
jgi:hypothetical protein